MSSLLSLSVPNPFKSSSDGDDHTQNQTSSTSLSNPTVSSPSGSPSGVKEDLSLLSQTIGRQFRGVAAFLAPPPLPHSTDTTAFADHSSASSSTAIARIKNDLAEIGVSFKTSLSLLSSNKAVSNISRLASNFLQFQDVDDEGEGDEDEYEEAVGITEEVVQFVEEISLRPECWTDFPLSLHSDFSMSDLQKEHAETIERLVPAFAALRHKICVELSTKQFWLIYFVLLLPRLDENNSKLLSTPEIVETRDVLLQMLQKQRNASVETSDESQTAHLHQDDVELNRKRDKSPPQKKDVPPGPGNAEEGIESADHNNAELWPEDEDDKHASVDAEIHPENEDDISFSDLEDDDNDLSRRLPGVKPAESGKISRLSESNEWVRLSETIRTSGPQQARRSISKDKVSEAEESNDWLTVDGIDLDSLEAA